MRRRILITAASVTATLVGLVAGATPTSAVPAGPEPILPVTGGPLVNVLVVVAVALLAAGILATRWATDLRP